MVLNKWLFPISIVSILLLSSCAEIPTQTQQNFKQGLYNLTGWNGATVTHYSGDDPNGLGTAEGIDIDGKVGYPLVINSLPHGQCIDSTGQKIDTFLNGTFKSQTFPPGVDEHYTPSKEGLKYDINGIPTQRGHWIVKYTSPYIQCGSGNDARDYHGFTQELRFHITGSGQVVQQN